MQRTQIKNTTAKITATESCHVVLPSFGVVFGVGISVGTGVRCVGTNVGFGLVGIGVGTPAGPSVGGLVASVTFGMLTVTFVPRTLPTLLEKLTSAILPATVSAAVSRRRPSMCVEPISKYVFQVMLPVRSVAFGVEVRYSLTCL